MEYIQYIFMLVPPLHELGMTLGIGASTFALIFYIQATRDGNVDATERRFLHTVVVVMRIAMALIISVLLFSGVIARLRGFDVSGDPIFVMEAILMAAVVINAALMQMRKMPMWLGPAIAGGTWYSLFLLQSVPFQQPTLLRLCGYYLVFVALFYGVYAIIRSVFGRPTQLQPMLSPVFEQGVTEVTETVIVIEPLSKITSGDIPGRSS